MNLHPDDLDDAVGRAVLAARRGRVLPHSWVAVPVAAWDRWYVVLFEGTPTALGRCAAVYRIRPWDLRLKRIIRPPWQLPGLARARFDPTRSVTVEDPGVRAGRFMTDGRLGRPR
jgi:hypothetical protein